VKIAAKGSPAVEDGKVVDVGTIGTVLRLTPSSSGDRREFPYIQVRFDENMLDGTRGGIEWCYEDELVRADAYGQFMNMNGRKPTASDVAASDNGVQLLNLYPEGAFSAIPGHPLIPGEIIGDGPVPHFDDYYTLTEAAEAPFEGMQMTAPVLLSDSQLRKMMPVGVVATEYFPLGDRGRAAVSWVGNEKHNPNEHLHWARGKSDDHLDALVRHLQDMAAPGADGWDTVVLPDGRVYQVRHASAASWRASAIAQLDAESVNGQVIRRLK
jgi:hypothetical protein